MTIIFKGYFPKRFVPYWKRIVVLENEVAEKTGESKSTMNKEGKEELTKKKRSHEDLDEEHEKRLLPNKKSLEIGVLLSEDEDVQDIDKDHEMDEIDRIDVKSSMLYHNETGDRFHDIGQSQHLLTRIAPTEKKKWPQKPCVYCRKYGTRRDTRYICSCCNIALCKSSCFSEYHSCK